MTVELNPPLVWNTISIVCTSPHATSQQPREAAVGQLLAVRGRLFPRQELGSLQTRFQVPHKELPAHIMTTTQRDIRLEVGMGVWGRGAFCYHPGL